MEGERIDTEHTLEVEELRKEVAKLRKQNEELKKALLGSLNARIYSLLGMCGFQKEEVEEEVNECGSE